MSDLTSTLYKAWKQAVLNESVINQFEAPQTDSFGRWNKGDQIIYGVRYQNEQFTYYARNLTQSFDIEGATEEKRVGDTGYLCRLNSYRALRPGAGNRPLGRQPDISADASHCRFHCQDAAHPLSLLRRDPLLSVPLTHFTWNAYYNVAPIEKAGHFLWIPATNGGNVIPHMLQRLTSELIEDAVALFSQLSQSILFFNALHAGASVNHIHFQAISHRHPLPVESVPLVNYKGYQLLTDYPAQAVVFNAKDQTTELITYVEKLQQADIPFNLAMASERIFVIARDGDNAIVSEFPGDGLAALGMCGAIATVDRNAYDTVNAALIESAFKKMVVPAIQVIDSLT
ncbi:MAG: hypothetical protein ACFB0D_02980 [Phormidesmis sp.]